MNMQGRTAELFLTLSLIAHIATAPAIAAGQEAAPSEEAGKDAQLAEDAASEGSDDEPQGSDVPTTGSTDNDEADSESNKGPLIPLPVEANTFINETGAVREDQFTTHSIQLVEVPLRMRPVNLDQDSDALWVKGPKPAKNFLAEVELGPAEEVLINLPQSGELQLSKTVRNDRYGVSPEAPEELTTESAIYCGRNPLSKKPREAICFHDTDDNGDFDRIAIGQSEVIDSHPYAVSVLWPSAKLLAPLPYQSVADADRSSMTFEYRNCGKDWDRPLFAIGRKAPANQDGPLELNLNDVMSDLGTARVSDERLLRALGMLGDRRIGFQGACRKGDRIESHGSISADSLPDGTILTQLGDLVFSVGSKKAGAPVKLLAEESNQSYRLERRALNNAQSGLSDLQIRIATTHRFSRPPFIASGAFKASEGAIKKGGTAYSVGFEYGYLGELSDSAKIRTLLSSRSLGEGTPVYGIPMSSRVVTRSRYGGYPSGAFGAFGAGRPNPVSSREVSTKMAWCAPLRKKRQTTEKDARLRTKWITYFEWSATCISMVGSQHTITKGAQPTFGVQRISHELDISTNDGNPPIKQLGQGPMEESTELRIVIDEVTDNGIKLREQIWYGDEMTSDFPSFVRRSKDGDYPVDHGAMKLKLVPTEDSSTQAPKFEVVVEQPPKRGDGFKFL